MKRRLLSPSLIATFLAGGMIGALLYAHVPVFSQSAKQIVWTQHRRLLQSTENTLTNPLLECAEAPANIAETVLPSLQTELKKTIENSKSAGEISYASVYFRDLNNGPWFGINESDEFFPASLLKLPLAMSFYDRAEKDPLVMAREITYAQSSATNEDQPFTPKISVLQGKKYSVRELLEIMLLESNNEAAIALADVAEDGQITEIYRELGLEEPKLGHDYNINAHKYASF
ncbi:MAG: hypothetical protein RIQ56_966, partial [Candidatus Parcubacteria bacterium]